MKRRSLFLLLVIVFCLPAISSLFHPGFFPSHDGEWMVVRLSDFHRSFVSGQIPVRWAARLNHGYGYPVFNFLYPLPFYLGELFYLFLGSFVSATKLIFILSILFSSLFMYLWIRDFWGDWAGLFSAMIYTYSPYRFLDVYVRGSIGEAVAFVFPPLIFWSATKLIKKGNRIYLVLGGLAFAGLITSHNTMAMLFSLVYGGFIFFRWLLFRQNKVFWRQLCPVFLGLGLACFFWLPALHDKQYVFFDQVKISNFFLHFPTLRQLLFPSWGYGPSLPLSDQDTLSFQVGILNLTIFILSLIIFGLKFLWSTNRKNYLKKNSKVFYFFLVFSFSLFLMLPASSLAWRLFLVYDLIQFPWRLLSLTTFSVAVLSGAVYVFGCKQLGKDWAWPLVLLIGVVFLVWGNYRYARPEYFVDRGEAFYTTNEGTTTVANEYLPNWVEEPPTVRAEEKAEIVSGKGLVDNLIFDSRRVSFEVKTEAGSEVQINTHYFPGWQVKLDGEKVPISYQNKKGLMRLKVGPGNHQVEAKFKETPIRLLANGITLLGFFTLLGLVIKRK